ncbi:hypothetical protein Psi02_33790 [Planotetraspora silvatica]|uniref:Nudix hydrolase domain-containing protein n=1 Tax=Planotetraspora silvatica TaxID=234614 RepID=A0A8J3XN77_9ACTN|nr:NUDIX domain-containing protein [Planotetraspora silvatica]GII46955.1 hypothetical protein Psi02_33790 [Planotetraspora silvatica]
MPATIDKIAWIHLEDGKVLSTRTRGKDVYYFPGGKREPGETDLDTLTREIDEELAVAVLPATAELLGVFEARAHGHAGDVSLIRSPPRVPVPTRTWVSTAIRRTIDTTTGDRRGTSPGAAGQPSAFSNCALLMAERPLMPRRLASA